MAELLAEFNRVTVRRVTTPQGPVGYYGKHDLCRLTRVARGSHRRPAQSLRPVSETEPRIVFRSVGGKYFDRSYFKRKAKDYELSPRVAELSWHPQTG